MFLRQIIRSLSSRSIRLAAKTQKTGPGETPEASESACARADITAQARPADSAEATITHHSEEHDLVLTTATQCQHSDAQQRDQAAVLSGTATCPSSSLPVPEPAESSSSFLTPTPDTSCQSTTEYIAEKDIYLHEVVELSLASTSQLQLLSATNERAASPSPRRDSATLSSFSARETSQSISPENDSKIMQRKIWVRRPGASATLVTVQEDDLVDSVRDVILEKYRNSLGRSIDAPDIALKLISREQGSRSLPIERNLGPEECIGRLLDSSYPGGQTIDDALIIDIPQQRRTPKPSPRVGNHHQGIAYPYYIEDHRPGESAREYFPPMALHSPHLTAHPHHPAQQSGSHLAHSMALVTSGQVAGIPSPGAHGSRKHRDGRPKYPRQHTSSPTILHSSQAHSNELKQPMPNGIPPPAPLPTPPAQADHRPSITPPNRTSSPRLGQRKKNRAQNQQQQQSANALNGESTAKLASAGVLDGKVPPINVLIVEDNPINLRLLEQFMRRLQVRWKTAVNGREAVNTWRTGGFHLVLMDIQLPVMNGLDATKEIRRLESVNGIGLGLVGGQDPNRKENGNPEIDPVDKLEDMSLFKSPVIIVALTASSLQSDRHEALAVGCNDFLTKPVGFPWMVRKVTEWGCMQALIDFDGWRQWKASAEKQDAGLTEEQKKARDKEEKAKRKAALTAMFTRPPPTTRSENTESKQESGGRSPVNGTSSRRGGRGGSGSGPQLATHAEESEE